MTIPYDVQQAGPEAVAFYESCIARGESPRLAEMLALRAAPRCMTDSVFTAGKGTLAQQFDGDEKVLEKTIKLAGKYGYKPNANDVYISQLAAFPGDPKAFVPSGDARGHIKKVCEERGWACEGGVKVKAGPKRERKSTKLSPDLVEQNVQKMIRKNPDLKRVPKRELAAEATLKHGAQK